MTASDFARALRPLGCGIALLKLNAGHIRGLPGVPREIRELDQFQYLSTMSNLTNDDIETIRSIVREELSEQQAGRPAAEPEPGSADDLAEKAMLAGDWKLAEQQGLRPSEAFFRRTGVDASEYDEDSIEELRAAATAGRN